MLLCSLHVEAREASFGCAFLANESAKAESRFAGHGRREAIGWRRASSCGKTLQRGVAAAAARALINDCALCNCDAASMRAINRAAQQNANSLI
jgi:hypothetical protein